MHPFTIRHDVLQEMEYFFFPERAFHLCCGKPHEHRGLVFDHIGQPEGGPVEHEVPEHNALADNVPVYLMVLGYCTFENLSIGIQIARYARMFHLCPQGIGT